MNLSQKMLAVAKGVMVDAIPYAPRIDLWYLKNKAQGCLPPELSGLSADQLARSQGWGLHKIILEYQEHGKEAIIDRCLGIYNLPQQGYYYRLPRDVAREISQQGDALVVTYHTPKGLLRGAWQFNDETLAMGITIPWITEHLVKGPADCAVSAYIYQNLVVEPCPEDYAAWFGSYREDALEVAYALTAGGPMHHILKVLCSPEKFYLLMNDHPGVIDELASGVESFYDRALEAACRCEAPVVLVGANFDETVTYPEFFRLHMAPWLRSASARLHDADKLMLCHTDGENCGLIDLLTGCGMDIAEALCPHPMTKLSFETYYRKWRAKGITIFGGIPSSILVPESCGEAEFDAYVKNIFTAVAPGDRFILGVADTTPPQAPIERLQRIGEIAKAHGRLPLKPGAAFSDRPPRQSESAGPSTAKDPQRPDGPFQLVQALLLKGDEAGLGEECRRLLNKGLSAQEILDKGLLEAMEIIGQRFKDNTVFIPEVLLSARAMNSVVEGILGKTLTDGMSRAKGRVLLGTVKGDLHDIGKNLVATMLKGSGFELIDLGSDVSTDKFVQAIEEHRPNLVGLSALLTTTMPQMKATIEAIEEAGLKKRIRIMVGGAPVSREFAENIGADAYCDNAGDAITTAAILMEALHKKE